MSNRKDDEAPRMRSGEVPVGYSNIMRISHNNMEFILDFGLQGPGMEEVILLTRVHLSPQHAKTMILTMVRNIQKYEAQYGKINYPTDDDIRKLIREMTEGGGGGGGRIPHSKA